MQMVLLACRNADFRIIAEIPFITIAVVRTWPIIEGRLPRKAIKCSGCIRLTGTVTAGTRAILLRAFGCARTILEAGLVGATARDTGTTLTGGAGITARGTGTTLTGLTLAGITA